MTAQTFSTTSQAGPNANVGGSIAVGARVLHCFYHTFDIPETPEVGDIYIVGYLPKGAHPVGGYMATTDIDSGTETFDMDLGIAANGVDAADPDFFVNGGVETGDATTDWPLTNSANMRLLTGKFPVETLGAKTRVQAVVNAVAQAGGTGTVAVCIYYTMPGSPTS